MSLRELLAGELVDIIEWSDESDDAMAWRFARPQNEIKNGAQLIVRPGQMAMLVDQGTVADVFQPGRFELTTANVPLLSSLRGWKYGFSSPFKADVIFLSTKQFVGRKWGTANPVILRDPELGPIRLRAYGTYAVRVTDARRFVQELLGASAAFVVDQVAEQLRDMVVARVSSALADSAISVYELAAKYAEVGARVQEAVADQFRQYGLSITQLVIENVSLPPEVEATLDQKSRLNVIGDLDRYARLQSADAVRDAARNPGGGAAAVVGLGVGAALGQRAAGPALATAPAPALAPPAGAASAGAEPPPLPIAAWYYVEGRERRGPVDEATLAQSLTPSTLVWTAGMAAWTPAAAVTELSARLKGRS